MKFPISAVITLIFFRIIDCVTSPEQFSQKFEKVSISDDCEKNQESDEIFGHRTNFHSDESGNVFCFRKSAIDNITRITSTSRSFEDPRFMCSKGPMSWYRGRRNIDFQGRPCLFWSTIPNSTIDNSSSSSSSFSMKRILPDEYENFCRNPDENPLGPWCHLEGGLKAPCFEPCRQSTETSSEFVCLNRNGFPYTEYDMSDILDLPQLIGLFDDVDLMYESRFVSPIKMNRLSTKSCISSGAIANQFGPWVAALDENANEFLKTVGRKILRDICVPLDYSEPPTHEDESLHDAIIEDEFTVSGCSFWRRCFSSCQDDITTCWEKDRDSYFGTKTTTVSGKSCLPWTQVSSEILKMANAKSNASEQYSLYSALLFEDPSLFLVKSRLFLNTENSCMLLNRRDSAEMKKTHSENSEFSTQKWNFEYRKMFQQGPGCFVKNNKTIEFDSCYSECEKEPKISLTKKLCLEKHRYSLCKPKKDDDWLKRGRKVN